MVIRQSIYQYLTGPIPAFSEWLQLHQPLPLINLDFSNVAVVREIIRAFGFQIERSIGWDIVFVPYPFNVFTHLAEHVRDFGLIGTIAISGILGITLGRLENLPLSLTVLGVRATLYAYLSETFFADLSFLAVGWWLTLFTVLLVLPWLQRIVPSSGSDRTVPVADWSFRK